MKLRFSAQVESDLSRILDYIRLNSHSSSVRKVASDIGRTLERIQQLPSSGRLQQDGISRKAVTLRYKYLIFYVQRERGFMDILTIQNPARHSGFEDA